ncbi:ATP-binding protein [Vibrio hippocampi]|uniref:Histidine kinase/HSP90-like ATPase domain-containing protein n=1 Tax=Vibrio hippocampi TaxID=654686 RepID=A0ABN8DF49_9VIBR|nr:ATP-binding protein [Vibrio hippocampi]CAH0525747.1 hypothetical protein VHP8226_01277 [Vibrio hippocampi]
MEVREQVFSRQYPSSIETSRVVAEDLKLFWRESDVSDTVVVELELCVVELVNNAYEHAYENRDGEPIEIFSQYHNGVMIIDVANFGVEMPQCQFLSALEADFLEPEVDDPNTWSTSGRGFIILAALVDKVELNREQNKNVFRLIKKIPL